MLIMILTVTPPPQIQGEKTAVEGIRYRGVFGTISTMVRTEGPRSLYNGLVAGLQRQLCFASVRIGLYDSVRDFYTGGKESECMSPLRAGREKKKHLFEVQAPKWC